MSWFKKISQKQITIYDIIKVVDKFILEEEGLPKELIMNSFLYEDSAQNTQQEYYSKVAQVQTKSPYRVENDINQNLYEKIKNLIGQGYSSNDISNFLNIDVNKINNIIRTIFPLKQQENRYRDEAIKKHRDSVKDIYTKEITEYNELTKEIIAEKLNVSPKIVASILKQYNNTSVPKIKEERQKYWIQEIKNFIKINNKNAKNITILHQMFVEKYQIKMRYNDFSYFIKLSLSDKTFNKNRNQIIASLKYFIIVSNGLSVKKVIESGKLGNIIDRFINKYKDFLNIVDEEDRVFMKNLLMTKIQLRDRMTELKDLNYFLNKQIKDPQKNKGNIILKIREMLREDIDTEEISQQTGVDIDDIERIKRIIEINETPLDYTEKHPSYFLQNREFGSEAKSEQNIKTSQIEDKWEKSGRYSYKKKKNNKMAIIHPRFDFRQISGYSIFISDMAPDGALINTKYYNLSSLGEAKRKGDEILNSFLKQNKNAQFSPENSKEISSPTISIEPYEPLIQEAVNEMKASNPNFFIGVNKINIDMGYGQFGSVSSKNPADININFNRIKNEITSQIGGSFDDKNPAHIQTLKDAIKRVIVHEKAHVQDASQSFQKDPSQFAKNPFPGGESVADMAENTYFGNK